MCTAFGFKGKDVIYGFNLDIDPDCWNYALYKTSKYFSVGITIGKTVYFTHGVNSNGHFSNIPYMNGESFEIPKGKKRQRIDLITDKYIRNKISFKDIEEILKTETITCTSGLSFHSLIGNNRGTMYIVEPGYGISKVKDNYALITNFPVLTKLVDYSNPFYGKNRYDKALRKLSRAKEDFSVKNGLKLLEDAKQDGRWGTRISFVYSKKESAVYYCENGDFSQINIHQFK